MYREENKVLSVTITTDAYEVGMEAWGGGAEKTLLFIFSPNLKTRVETLTKAQAEQQQLNSVKYLKCRAKGWSL